MHRGPTEEEFKNYDGMHCRSIWCNLDDCWQCPVCERDKKQILQWGKRKGSNARIYGSEGWKAAIHKHHDHGGDIFNLHQARFEPTYICGACNQLDARLKKSLGLNKGYSFSPHEMNLCLKKVEPNQPIKSEFIDFDKARAIALLNHWIT